MLARIPMPVETTIFENENFIAVDKPACVLTTPAREKDDPRPCLGLDLQARLNVQIFPVHRLDFEASGLVLFAKNPAAHRLAQGWFEHTKILKTYQALSVPMPSGVQDWTEWNSKLVRGKRRTFEAPHGKPSRTRARVVEAGRSLRWELQPVTGRPHQLRTEMAKHGFPIAGDVLYGAPAAVHKGIALKAVQLDFAKVGERLGLPEVLNATALDWAPSVIFYFVRHGQTSANAQHLLAGSGIDIPLTKEGHEQAHRLALALKRTIGQPIRHLIVSTMIRTRETAKYLADELGVQPQYNDQIIEWNLGEWEGKSFEEFGHLLLGDGEPKKGESRSVFFKRVEDAWRDLHSADEPYLVVSHGAVWLALQDLLQIPRFKINNCDLVKVEWSGEAWSASVIPLRE